MTQVLLPDTIDYDEVFTKIIVFGTHLSIVYGRAWEDEGFWALEDADDTKLYESLTEKHDANEISYEIMMAIANDVIEKYESIVADFQNYIESIENELDERNGRISDLESELEMCQKDLEAAEGGR